MMTYLPHDRQLGSSTTWASGLPYSIISRFFALDNDEYLQFRTRFGSSVVEPLSGGQRFDAARRNSERNDATLDVNLNVRRTFVVGRTAGAAFLEVFNLLNANDLRIFTYEPDKGQTAPPGGDLGGFRPLINDPLTSIPLQINGERRFGRRFQIGVQFQF